MNESERRPRGLLSRYWAMSLSICGRADLFARNTIATCHSVIVRRPWSFPWLAAVLNSDNSLRRLRNRPPARILTTCRRMTFGIRGDNECAGLATFFQLQ